MKPQKGMLAADGVFLSEEDARAWLVLGSTSPAGFEGAVKATVRRIERYVSMALDKATYTYTTYEGVVQLPKWANLSITSIVDQDGAAVAHTVKRGCVTLTNGAEEDGAIITFVAGYGADSDDVIELHFHAQQLLAHYWEHRGDENAQQIPHEIVNALVPFSVDLTD